MLRNYSLYCGGLNRRNFNVIRLFVYFSTFILYFNKVTLNSKRLHHLPNHKNL